MAVLDLSIVAAKRVKTEVDIVEIWGSTAAPRHCWCPPSKHPQNKPLGKWTLSDELEEIKDVHCQLYNFPGVVGMIHVTIKKPKDRGVDYNNRKDYYSIVLQAAVGKDMRFTNVFAGYAGKVHDARIFCCSPLKEVGQQLCGPGHMLGDSTYPNIPWLLTLFKNHGHLIYAQVTYNRRHSSIYCNVERAFGLLKGRWTRLQYLDQRSLTTSVQKIIACYCLHNICISRNDIFDNFARRMLFYYHLFIMLSLMQMMLRQVL